MAIIFRSRYNQRGRGIGRIFSTAFTFLKNFLFPKIVQAATSTTGKALAKEVGSSLAKASVKSLSGESTFKEAGKEELARGIKKIQVKLSKLNKSSKKSKKPSKKTKTVRIKSNFFD
jgi:hypothetical protein